MRCLCPTANHRIHLCLGSASGPAIQQSPVNVSSSLCSLSLADPLRHRPPIQTTYLSRRAIGERHRPDLSKHQHANIGQKINSLVPPTPPTPALPPCKKSCLHIRGINKADVHMDPRNMNPMFWALNNHPKSRSTFFSLPCKYQLTNRAHNGMSGHCLAQPPCKM